MEKEMEKEVNMINNRNENIKKRAKSAAKARKNPKNLKILNNNNQNLTFNNGNANNYIKKNNRLKKNKSPLIKNIKINNNDYIEDEYDFNNNMNQFENIVNVINLNGFNKIKNKK